MKLLIRSLLVALAFLGAYSGWLRVWPGAVAVPQGLNQDNLIKMQEYAYRRAGHCATVIVGSSLAAKLRPQVLPPDVCNLALRGLSVFEGFELMRRAGHAPQLILLETNVLERTPNPSTVDELFSPALYPLRRWYPGLQARHQPLNEALAGGLAVLARLRPAAARQFQDKLGVSPGGPGVAPPAEDSAAYPFLSPTAVAAAHADYSRPPQQPGFGQNLALLRRYVGYFRARGSRVVLFEMPVDAGVCQSAKMRAIRQQLAADAVVGGLAQLPRPDCAAYRTTDGEHLTDPSAWRYSAVLARELAGLTAEAAGVAQQNAAPSFHAKFRGVRGSIAKFEGSKSSSKRP